MHKYRTHKCGKITLDDVGKKVKLSGWIHRKRNHGGVFFLDLRDYTGIVQLICINEGTNRFDSYLSLNYESVVTIVGRVCKRGYKTINKNIPSGEVEVFVENLSIESKAEILPFCINSNIKQFNVNEDLRLKYRFLDLRRKTMYKNIILRSKVIKFLRDQMFAFGFYEFQTPILTSESPEGARDFIVPSRLHHGKFYALPQAPQQFKQLLMISGFDKYFQIAPCFRDEDARADRAPGEFYQLDIEMSYVEQNDIFNIVESLLINTFKKFSNLWNINDNFFQISYSESMLKYGTDKPDLRNNIVISDVSDIFYNSKFSIFVNSIKEGKFVRAILLKFKTKLSRKFYKDLNDYVVLKLKIDGISNIFINKDGKVDGPMVKFLDKQKINILVKRCNLNLGESVFFICDSLSEVIKNAGKIRDKIARYLNLNKKNTYKFCWIVDYPIYKWDKDNKKIIFFHNPFSMPQKKIKIFNIVIYIEDILRIKGYQYDIVCNGIELSSGAIRINNLLVLYKIFEYAGYTKEMVNKNFSAIVRGLKFGAPPHGGIAPGIDRIIMMLANVPNIREIISFPMNQHAEDILMSSPSIIDEKVLYNLGIKLSRDLL